MVPEVAGSIPVAHPLNTSVWLYMKVFRNALINTCLIVLTPLRTQYILDVLQRIPDSSVVRCILLVGTKFSLRSHLFLRWAKLIEN